MNSPMLYFQLTKHIVIMKKVILFAILSLGLLLAPSCKTIHTNKNGIPPGQAKKLTGSQSAAPYAPGHNK